MPSFCMVPNCGSNGARDHGISFFRIPSIASNGGKIMELAKTRRDKWISALKRGDLTETKIKYGRICSLHFHSGKPAKLHDKDNPDWIPTKLMGHRTSIQVHNSERSSSKGTDIHEDSATPQSSTSSSNMPSYCTCRKADDGKTPMLACDSGYCVTEWYHLSCVGLEEVPTNAWVCSNCIS